LGHEEGVPFLRGTVGSVLFSVNTRYVDFLLSTGNRVNIEGACADILRAAEEDAKVSRGEGGVEIHDVSQVDESNLDCGLGSMRGEHGLNYLKEDGSVLVDDSLSDGDLTENSAASTSGNSSSRGTTTSCVVVLLTLESVVTHGRAYNTGSGLTSSSTSGGVKIFLLFGHLVLVDALFVLLSTLLLVFRSSVLGFFFSDIVLTRAGRYSFMDGVSGSINCFNFHSEVTLCLELHKSVRSEDEKLSLQFPVLFILLLLKDTD
jgi:hypothetical protein